MSPEVVLCARQKAIEELPLVVNETIGIEGSGSGRFQRVHFGRDAFESIIEVNEENQGDLTTRILDASFKSLETALIHEGSQFDPITRERPGRKAHEVHTSASPQDRLAQLFNDPKWRPLVVRNPDGTYRMKNYLSDDATSKHVIAVGVTERTVRNYWGNSSYFMERHWPAAKRGVLHDNAIADEHGSRLIVSDAYGPLLNRNWKDSDSAYKNEEGDVPPPPYIYLTVNATYYWALLEAARMAQMSGEVNLAKECMERASELKHLINTLFWSPKLEYFVPLIDGEDRQDEIVTDDPIDALWAEALEPKIAKAVISRLSQPDMLNVYGIRTRSSDSKMFAENGAEAYHNGPNWPRRTKQAAKGAEKYGYFAFARDLDERVFTLESIVGRKELVPIAKDGFTILTYEEDGEPAANDPQSWEVFGTIGRTAAIINRR